MTSHKNRWCFGWIFDRRKGVAKPIPYQNQGSLIETTNEVLQATHTHGELIAFTWTAPFGRKRLVWAEDGRVGFEDEKAGNILLDEWPEFRQHDEIENAIEAHKEEL